MFHSRRLQRQRGVSLLEVMISLVIVGIGVLGLIGMQARAMSNQRDSFDRKAAAELMAQISERMRANHLGFMANNYASTLLPADAVGTATACVLASPCTAAQQASSDLVSWHTQIRNRLPSSGAVIGTSGAAGSVIGSGANSMRITMIWREASPTGGTDAACAAVGVNDGSFRCLVGEVFP